MKTLAEQEAANAAPRPGSDPPFSEPTGNWEKREARKIKGGDYVLGASDERLKVIASYSSGMSGWYIEAYCHGEPTKRIGLVAGGMIEVEV